jgi:hypothetical protein
VVPRRSHTGGRLVRRATRSLTQRTTEFYAEHRLGADVVLIEGADAATGLSSPSSADRGVEAIRGIVADANPPLRLAGAAGLLLTGSHNGCWR